MSGEPEEAAEAAGEPVRGTEDTSGVEAGVKVGEEVADVRVGGEAAGEADVRKGGEAAVHVGGEAAPEANVHVGIEAGDGTGAAVGAGVADAEVRVGGEATDEWPRVNDRTEDTAGQI